MKRISILAFVTCLFFGAVVKSVNAQGKSAMLLWQLGKPDSSIAEFFGAPGGPVRFEKDGFFIVGRSDTKNNWPYYHPGPADAWAGNRQHTFSILFGLKKTVTNGNCSLQFMLADAHDGWADSLDIEVNGSLFYHKLPRGAGKGIDGDVSKGKKYQFNILFPAGLLKKGDNAIHITTVTGSWFIYDWIGLITPADMALQPVGATISLTGSKSLPFLQTRNNTNYQTAGLSFTNTGDAAAITVRVAGMAPQPLQIGVGHQYAEVLTPEVTKDTEAELTIEKNNKVLHTTKLPLTPVKKMTIYILPHSHTDIGYTEIQTNVEKKQVNNLLKGIEYAHKTKDYPAGARFVWNVEVAYVADLFLQRMTEAQRQSFYEAVKNGGVALNGMYLNTLTGLCRPEELLKLFRFATEVSKQTNTPIDAAMISDVPGYTWGTVTAMAQAGIRYFSVAPNFFDRIGDILEKWTDKPFYWLSPSGNKKVLVWIPYSGYALSHTISKLSANFVTSYTERLQKINYPYDIAYIRWSGHGDNAEPDIDICDFVKEWNATYSWPKFIISSTHEAFSAFEKAYGNRLPEMKGDWTGYWEDGAGSSAFETAQNRASSDKLSQAETMWAMFHPENYPAVKFKEAWKNILLYSEHTWGADCSVTDPLNQKTIEQWNIKKSYATAAHEMGNQLLQDALPKPGNTTNAIDVINTSSWQRTNLVLVPSSLSAGNDVVKDEKGTILLSQRLSTGELAFVAGEVPPFAAKRFMLQKGKSSINNPVTITDSSLDNGIIKIAIDKTSGAITGIRHHAIPNNFVDTASGNALNEYLFLNGNNLNNLLRNEAVTISIKEKGPVVSSLLIESKAPGAHKFTREINLVQGFDFVEIKNIVDKKRAELNPNPGDWHWANVGGKESLNFSFPFNVSAGAMTVDIPMAIMQPEKDQLPGSCKNWLQVGRWTDVSNNNYGITWATSDAPLIEVGGITATMLGGQTNPAVWRKKIEPTQQLYSWALNNHWETNYRAYQEGIITFRYALRPHRQFVAAEATQFATAFTQPLIITKAGNENYSKPLLQLSSKNIIVLACKPADEGNAWVVTLFNSSNEAASVNMEWASPVKKIYYSNTAEQAVTEATGAIAVDAWDVVTIRAER